MANSAITFNTAGLASATSPGLVGTGAQTFAGDKTFNGLVSASGGIINTGLTGANATTVTTSGSGKIGERLPFTYRSVSIPSANTWAIQTTATVTITEGVWLLIPYFQPGTVNVSFAAILSTSNSSGGIASIGWNIFLSPQSTIVGGMQAVFPYRATASTPLYLHGYAIGATSTALNVQGEAIRIA